MQNDRLDETKAEIKTVGRNINNLRYADDTTLMAESEEELKSLLRVKGERENTGLNATFRKLRSGYLVPSLHDRDGETMETVRDFILGGSKITVNGDCSYEIKRCLEEKL